MRDDSLFMHEFVCEHWTMSNMHQCCLSLDVWNLMHMSGGVGERAHHHLKALDTGHSRMARETQCLPFVSLHCTAR
jgi:hypothetical protein